MSSAGKYERLRALAVSASSSASEAKSDLNSVSKEIEEGIVVGGRPFDDGILQECISLLDAICSNMDRIYAHCNLKLNKINYDGSLRNDGYREKTFSETRRDAMFDKDVNMLR